MTTLPARIAAVVALKAASRKIVMVTAYDAVTARLAAAAGVDIVLVGDSAANTILGYSSTREVSLDEMIFLTRAVHRGLIGAASSVSGTRPLLVGDMPLGTYESADDLAVRTARRFVEAGCEAVKLEGAEESLERIRAIVADGIPVMGHVGLLPQRAGTAGLRARGRTMDDGLAIARDAHALAEAGCFAIVFEAIAAAVASLIVPRIAVPVIGIGAGSAPDGQVLVFHDIVGLSAGRAPRFVKRYADGESLMRAALEGFAEDVRAGRYPTRDHEYGIEADELARLRAALT